LVAHITQTASANFGFLDAHDEGLTLLAAQAERLFGVDAPACIAKLRTFAEYLARAAAAHTGLYPSKEESQDSLLRTLRDRNVTNGHAADLFHLLRKAGNRAQHENQGSAGEALSALRAARELAVWFHRSFGRDPKFKPEPFIPPQPPMDASASLRRELEELRRALDASTSSAAEAQARAEEAQRVADEAARARLSAEARAEREAADRLAAESMIEEAAARELEMNARFEALQVKSISAPAEVLRAVIATASQASETLELSEASTRLLIDEQLRKAGWEASSSSLRYAEGARPQKGRNLAIAEWPTAAGFADYMLFVGLMPIAIVEAKRASKNVPAVLAQAERYARALDDITGLTLAGSYPDQGREPFVVPFVFATNGRGYLKQIAEASGIWFRDARLPTNLARPLNGWHSPEGLVGLLKQDIADADQKLAQESSDYLLLRPYQLRAIHAVESAIQAGQRSILLAMATGTGKTKTCIGLCYRLLKAKRFKRILFLVDRSALEKQTGDAFKETRVEQLQTFASVYRIAEPEEVIPEASTKLQIDTVQSFVRRVLYEDGALPVDAYDCILIDECHRGYTLDREMGEGELLFRDEADYISKYRRVLEHFDAVKIGLTATPAVHTRDIFGEPVFTYRYPEAVIDGFLVDHEPPTRIITALAEDGITFQVGEQVEVWQPRTENIQLSLLPDEVHIEIEQFNRRVLTENFNRTVCAELARHIDPSLPAKTLIFCATDAHADMVVRLLKEAFAAQYGSVEDSAVRKITGSIDHPLQAIREFKNEPQPSVVVTVDLLTTGIDVPSITNLVFLRRVKSRILYEQMIGRATRLCPNLFGPGQDKEVFRIFDAVDLYATLSKYSDMKPVVANATLPFKTLIADVLKLKDEPLQQEAIAQLVVRLDRKRRHLDERAVELIDAETNMDADGVLHLLRTGSTADTCAWLKTHERLGDILDAKSSSSRGGVYISHHDDEVRRVEQGYGPGNKRPEDYLDAFSRFVHEGINDLPALLVVTQRPRDLTRAQLKSLRLALDAAGYPEAHLRSAWRGKTNQDIAASIIGHIRQAALGDALIPYDERVQAAMKRILASRAWTPPQAQWLKRIGQQLQKEVVVDREALDAEGGLFASSGGFARINKVFDGKLESILGDVAEEVWKQA
jgi:type I restriction enzyme R subunit